MGIVYFDIIWMIHKEYKNFLIQDYIRSEIIINWYKK